MLGTTFGVNYLADAASLSVLEVIERENLLHNAQQVGDYTIGELRKLSTILDVRGRGLMIGFDLPENKKSLRTNLLMKHNIFTGEAKPNTVRLLPSLAVTKTEIDIFLKALTEESK